MGGSSEWLKGQRKSSLLHVKSANDATIRLPRIGEPIPEGLNLESTASFAVPILFIEKHGSLP